MTRISIDGYEPVPLDTLYSHQRHDMTTQLLAALAEQVGQVASVGEGEG